MASSTQTEEPDIRPGEAIPPNKTHEDGTAKAGVTHREPETRSFSMKWILLLVFAAGLVVGGIWYWSYSSIRESTDDAQIDGHLRPVSARISGTVIKVLIRDNQYV